MSPDSYENSFFFVVFDLERKNISEKQQYAQCTENMSIFLLLYFGYQKYILFFQLIFFIYFFKIL